MASFSRHFEMLKSLLVKNYALISDAEVQFKPGLNILTGETGAGKSIIVGALGSVLGERVDTSIVRDGADKAVIEGTFDVREYNDLQTFLAAEDLGISDDELVLRREISASGRSRAFVNDSPVQVSVLQQVGDFLVDLHGQHEHQSLLKTSHHLRFLDQYGGLGKDVEAVKNQYFTLTQTLKQLRQLQEKQTSVHEKRDFYRFQISEIDKIAPASEEEATLLKEEKIIRNSEKLFQLTNDLYKLLYEEEYSVFDGLNQARGNINELVAIDVGLLSLQKDLDAARVSVEEAARVLQTYQSGIEFSPEKLEAIQSRLAELGGLKKKYNRSIPDILDYRDQIQKELEEIDNLDQNLESLEMTVASEHEQFSTLCTSLTQKRKQVAARLEAVIPEVLAFLGMPGARFKVAISNQQEPDGLAEVKGVRYRAAQYGMDLAEFLISANTGEELRPLRKVASGGEISRIMLALKSVTIGKAQIPVLIFDEIDSGVSGRIANAVGRKLQDISTLHQIICITHLPQIACMGEHHYLVEKNEHDGRTQSTIRKLSNEQRTEAIARLLAGENISEAHLNSAKELLKDAVLN